MSERLHAQAGRHRILDGPAVVDCRCGYVATAQSMSKARAAFSEHMVSGNRRPGVSCTKCGELVSHFKAKNRLDLPDGTVEHVHCTYAGDAFKRDRGREAREHRDAVAYAWFAGDVTGRR